MHHMMADDNPVEMRTNVGVVERVLSVAVGSKLALSGLVRGRCLYGKLLTAAGSYLTYRGLSGYCPAYASLGATASGGLSPLVREIRVLEAITIQRPAEELYRFWRDLNNLPRVMRHVQQVTVLDERRSRWRVDGPGESSIEWEAAISADDPNVYLEWASVEGEFVHHRGAVEFEPAGERGTIVRVMLLYRPLGGAVAAFLAKLFQREPGQEIHADLRRFKQLMETGEIADASGPSARPEDDREVGDEGHAAARRRRTGSAADAPHAVEDDVPSRAAGGLDEVDEAMMESFPASDPPAWTGDRGGQGRR